MARGILLVFEGIDGSGLTTHSKRLAEGLRARGLRAVYSKEPTHGPIGLVIRELLSMESVDHELLGLLYAADRVYHFRVSSLAGIPIGEALDSGYIVVLDRYKYSSIAYQGLGADEEWLWRINSAVPEADAVIYIDVEPHVAFQRIKRRGKTYYYEDLEKLTKIKARYERVLKAAESMGAAVFRVKGSEGGVSREVGEVQREILELVMEFIGSKS